MKQWNELCAKGTKQQRLRRVGVEKEINTVLLPFFKQYAISKCETVLNEARQLLIDNIETYSPSSQKRIKYFLD